MKTEKINWLVQLTDNVSGPIDQITGSLSDLTSGFEVFDKGVAGVVSELGAFATSSEEVSKGTKQMFSAINEVNKGAGQIKQSFNEFKGSVKGVGQSFSALQKDAGNVVKSIDNVKLNAQNVYKDILSVGKSIEDVYTNSVKVVDSVGKVTNSVSDVYTRIKAGNFSVEDALSSAIEIAAGISEVTTNVGLVASSVDQVTAGVSRVTTDIGKVTGGVNKVGKSVNKAFRNAGNVAKSFDKVKGSLSGFGPGIETMSSGLKNLKAGAGTTTKGFSNLFKNIGKGIKSSKGFSVATKALKMFNLAQMRAGVVSALAAIKTGLLTAAQWALNLALNANPVGLIVAAITALIGVVAAIIYKYDEWGAAMSFILGPIGIIINIIQSLRRHWDSIKEAFESEGIIGGLKRLGLVIFDAVLMPIQQLLELLSDIPFVGDFFAKGAEGIQNFRKDLDLLPEDETVDVEVNKEVNTNGVSSTSIVSPVAPKAYEDMPLTGVKRKKQDSVHTGENAEKKSHQIQKTGPVQVRIENLIKEFTITTNNIEESTNKIKEQVKQALMESVRDFETT